MTVKTDKDASIEEYLRKREAAQYGGISVRTLTEWMRRGIVSYSKLSHRVVLFRKRDLDEAIDRFRVKAVGEK